MSRQSEANGVAGWALTPEQVVADLRRILRGRNADTVSAAIALIEGATP